MQADAREQDAVIPMESDLLLRTTVLNDGEYDLFAGERLMEHAEWICCKMCLMMEEREGPFMRVSVNVDRRGIWTGATQFASSHGSEQCAKERMELTVEARDLRLWADEEGVCDKVKQRPVV